jgi:predicted ferric reductase
MLSKWYYQDWFANPYKYVAKAASLTTTILMCSAIVLSARWRTLEMFFGGLDKMYQIHRNIGRWAFFIILLHPVFLAFDRLPDIRAFFAYMWFQSPQGERYMWGLNVGVVALLAFFVLVALTLWVKLPYDRWKRTHEFFGLVLVVVIAHVFIIRADVAHYPILGVWLYMWLGLATISFVYIRFLYRRWGPRFDHKVVSARREGEILVLRLAPTGRQMDFRPGQFVYTVVHKDGITPEPHPYSIANGYNLEAEIQLGIKQVGDHTRSLDRLEPGDPVSLYGPYGHFSEAFLSAERDCVFIGAGIGITPFIGMWHVALHSEDRYESDALPEPIREMHPEILKRWHSPLVSLFYVSRTPADASFEIDIQDEVKSSRFKGFPGLERRGHHFEVYITSERGRITVDYLDDKVAGGIRDKFVFLCGPDSMVNSLITQMREMGMEQHQIIVEDFNLV